MTDTFGRNITYLRISVTELCNLRCRYCMPETGVCKKSHDEILTEEETVRAAESAAILGIRKIRITGGEPLVKRNIVTLCDKISRIPGVEELCLTTNGIRLDKLAIPLRDAGVSRLNISLDTLDADKYRFITRIGNLSDALSGIESALQAGFKKIKLNAVLIGGFNDTEITALAELTKKWPVDMRFIELMPMPGSIDFGPESYLPCSAVTAALPDLVPVERDGSVARLYRLPGALGNIGLIRPLSAHFCAECSRLRLTADGKLKPCLHSSLEFPLKGLDRDGMLRVFRQTVSAKPEWHGRLDYNNRSCAERHMNQIGG